MLSYLCFEKTEDFDVYFKMILNTKSNSLIMQIDDEGTQTLKDNRSSSNLLNLTTITKQILIGHLNLRLRQRYPLINLYFPIHFAKL